ncbi:MAG: formate dehydrogenase accessory protein FdhE [Thermomicrobiaceae bacterium]
MAAQSQQDLESLALEDPTSRPLALLQIEALRAGSDPVWEAAATALERRPPSSAVPAIHQSQIPVDRKKLAQLTNQLIGTLKAAVTFDTVTVPDAISDESSQALIQAIINGDDAGLHRVAEAHQTDPAILATIGHCASLPLLLAIGQRVGAERNADFGWQPGYCPVCGSWPTLAEARGLERQQWLRCGRCAASWRTAHQRCVFCENTNHQQLGYMAPEAERESRRATTCEQCKGYLKVFATVSPYSIEDILRQDLASLELDIAAIDQGYTRPDRPGFPIQVELVARRPGNGRWFPWR